MRVISVNVNGIRAAAKKGFFAWLESQNADVVCLQEVRAQAEQLDAPIYHPEGYHCYYVDGVRKGYSGVAILSRVKPKKIVTTLGYAVADDEARFIECDFGELAIISLYMPSGTSVEGRQAIKYEFMDFYEEILKKNLKKKKSYIICGDWNIAHKKIDIKNWQSNQKTSGFLPEERAWMDKLIDDIGYVDAFRVVNQEAGEYTWWSNRGRAWDNNVGWRIDYQITTPELRSKINHAFIFKDERFSDHAPLIVDYDYTLA